MLVILRALGCLLFLIGSSMAVILPLACLTLAFSLSITFLNEFIGSDVVTIPANLLNLMFIYLCLGITFTFWCLWIVSYITPLSFQQKIAFKNKKVTPVKLDPRKERLWENACRKFNIKRCAFMEVKCNSINAFAMSNFYQKRILITSGLLDVIDDDEFLFLVGHELAHIHCKDALVSTAWCGVINTLTAIGQLCITIETSLLNTILNAFRPTHRIHMIAYIPLATVVHIIHHFSRLTKKCSIFFFLNIHQMIDSWFSRQVELRCDRLSVQKTQCQVGALKLLTKLPNGGEFNIDWFFRSHPNNKKRIGNIINA